MPRLLCQSAHCNGVVWSWPTVPSTSAPWLSSSPTAAVLPLLIGNDKIPQISACSGFPVDIGEITTDSVDKINVYRT